MNNLRIGLGLAWLLGVVSLTAAEAKVKTAEKAPPAEVSEAMRNLLKAQAIQVLAGDKALYEFWFRKDIPLKAKPEAPAKGLDALEELTFVGITAVGEGQRDYKDNEIAPGTYTMRYSLQPQDGDHLGTSDYLFFLVLVPVKNDTALDSLKTYRSLVKTSAKASAAGHPIVLSLRPSSEAGSDPALTTPAEEHKAVRLTLPAQAPEGAKASLTFELVFEGRYKG